MAATFDPRPNELTLVPALRSALQQIFLFFSFLLFFHNLVLHLPAKSFHSDAKWTPIRCSTRLFQIFSLSIIHFSFVLSSSRETKDDNRREESTWCDLDCRSNFISVSCRLSPTRPSERFASARSIDLVTRANQRRDNLNANVCEENVSRGNHILLEQRGKGRKGRGFEVFDDGKIFIVCEGEWYFRFHIAV